MDNLQKPFARKFLPVFFLIFLVLPGWETASSQKLKSDAPPLFSKCWEYPTDQLTDHKIASDNESNLYISLLSGKLISISSSSGEKHWETELGGEIIAAPLIDQETVYIAVKNIGLQKPKSEVLTIRSLDKKTGLTQRNIKLTVRLSTSERAYLYNFEKFLLVVGDGGDVYSINKSEGQIIWAKNLPTALSAQPLVKDEEIFLGTIDRRIISFSTREGSLIGEWKLPAPPSTFIEADKGENFVWGDGRGALTSFNKKSKTSRWKFRNGAEISNITITRQGLLISSFDNFIYLISETEGALLWKKRMTGRILNEPQVNGEFVIIRTTDDSFASVIGLNDGKLINKIALEEENIFTGQAIQTGDYFVYTTRKGVLGFRRNLESCATD